jgi:Txe/YoeB family toxin of Txe-Axe toxin-antitoxin module
VKLIFSDNAWDDYLYWQKTDKKILHELFVVQRSHKIPGPIAAQIFGKPHQSVNKVF